MTILLIIRPPFMPMTFEQDPRTAVRLHFVCQAKVTHKLNSAIRNNCNSVDLTLFLRTKAAPRERPLANDEQTTGHDVPVAVSRLVDRYRLPVARS